MNRRHFLSSAAAAAAATALPTSLLTSVVHAQAKGKLLFLTPASFSLAFSPVLHAVAAGHYEKAGVQVGVETGRGAAQVVQLVSAKQVQTGRTGGANFMIARVNNNAPVISIGTIAQRSPFSIISSNENPITKPEDVVGKTIGMQSSGGSMEATLDLMLMRAGISGDSLRRERVADTAASFGMIQAKRVDGFLGNTSASVRLVEQNYPVTTMTMDDGIPGQVYIAEENELKANRDSYVAFIAGTYASVRELLAMDDAALKKAIAQMAKRFDIPGAKIESVALADLKANRELWKTSDPKKVLRHDEKHWEEAESLLRKADLLKQPTTKPIYTNEIWEAAIG